MAVDLAEVEAVAAALTEPIAELLNDNHNALVDLLNSQDTTKLKAVMDLIQVALGEIKAHEDQRAWNEDVRAFAITMIGNGAGALEPMHCTVYAAAAINLADEIQTVRKLRAQK